MTSRTAAAAALVLCVLPLSACGAGQDDGSSYACPPPVFFGSKVYFPRPVDDTFVVGAAVGKGDVEACTGAGSDAFASGPTTVYRVPGVKPAFGFSATLDGQRYYFALKVGKDDPACQREGVVCS